jgi:lipoate-protein ligase A
MTWSVQTVATTAAAFHSQQFSETRAVYVVEVTGASVVLGSRQSRDLLNREACHLRGVDIVVRRSGGGIVYLVPSEHVWVDVVIGRGDPLWTDDVRTSMRWLGDAWSSALSLLGLDGCRVHDGPLVADELGELVCFASVGPGEVVDQSGAKLVGIAQRRTRDYARFQCTLLRRWEPDELLGLLAHKQYDSAVLRQRIQVVDAESAALVAAFMQSLPV